MGTPLKEQWPTIENLCDFTFRFPKWKKQPLQDLIKNMPPLAVDLLEKLLIYDPSKRITAVEALAHPYFILEEEWLSLF